MTLPLSRRLFMTPDNLSPTYALGKARILLPGFLFWVLLAAVLAFVAYSRSALPAYSDDDAYITFRYAQNLVAGRGFVYNPGEKVQGTTTPLYTLLLAGLSLTGRSGNFPLLARNLNLLFDTLTALSLVWLFSRLTRSRITGLCMGGLYAINNRVLLVSNGGMESSFYALLLVLALGTTMLRRFNLSACFVGLALITRPEGAFLASIIFPAMLLDQKRLPLKPLTITSLIASPWFIFAWFYFGSPIPHSVLAKAQVYDVPEAHAIREFLTYLARTIPLQGPFYPGIRSHFLRHFIFAVPGLIVLAAGIYKLARRQRLTLVWPAYLALYVLVYSIANPIVFAWYLGPLESVTVPLAMLGISMISSEALARLLKRPRLSFQWQFIPTLLATAIIGLPQVSSLQTYYGADEQGAPWMVGFHRRELDYQQGANLLAPLVDQNTLIALPEIGAFGYYSQSRILDTVGLVSPAAVSYYPLPPRWRGSNNISPSLILDMQPDYVLSLDVFSGTLREDAGFNRTYRALLHLPSRTFGGKELTLWQRQDLPVPALLQTPSQPDLPVSFGPSIRLLSHCTHFYPTSNSLELTLYWQAIEPIPLDYSVFVHVMGPDGTILEQADGYPGEGEFPFTRLGPGELLVDRRILPWPDLPDDQTPELYVGVYDWGTGDRLPARNRNGNRLPFDRLSLDIVP